MLHGMLADIQVTLHNGASEDMLGMFIKLVRFRFEKQVI